jgi:two-component system sensor histidine kinase CiaH
MDFGGVSTSVLLLVSAFLLGVLIALLFIRTAMAKHSNVKISKTKDEFVGLASHYLLTPISIIQGAIAQLQEQENTMSGEDRHKLYDNITKGQQRLWILAEQFVLVSQIEDGMLKLKMETANVRDMVQSALSSVDVFAREKNIKLELIDQTQAIQETRFDTRRMKQAVMAVLDNAIKFSPEGATVTATVTQEPHSFAIDIADMGSGMTDRAIETATQRFARGTSSYTFDHEGIGLGLYTANAIIKEHGGEIRFDTSKKNGTLVTLRFPNQ